MPGEDKASKGGDAGERDLYTETQGDLAALTENVQRFSIRFRALLDERPPFGWMFIDEAIDRLGFRRFPAEWGRSAVWGEHPFRYEERNGRYWRYVARRNEASYWELKRSAFEPMYYEEAALSQADSLYKQMVVELSEALETGKVNSRQDDGDTSSAVPRLRWSNYEVSMFYTGCIFKGLVRGRRSAASRHRIVIDQTTFQAWLDPPQARPSSKSLGEPLVAEVVARLGTLAVETGTKFKKEWLIEDITRAFREQGREISENQIIKRVWDNPGFREYKFPHGPPREGLSNATLAQRPAVRAAISRLVGSNQGGPVTPPAKPGT